MTNALVIENRDAHRLNIKNNHNKQTTFLISLGELIPSVDDYTYIHTRTRPPEWGFETHLESKIS